MPPRRRGRSPRRDRRARNVAAAAILAAFFGLELAVILTVANGPTLDEGIYLTAGRRTLEGSGGADGYLGWFAGSLLWPSLAGIGDAVDGLAGARVVAALLVTIALVGAWRASATLFGSRAGLCTAALGAVTGPVLALGHLAVIDAPAAAGLGVALWSVAELWRRDHRGWLVAGAAAYAFAVLGKYPVAVCGVPLLLLLVALRGRRAAMDLALFAAAITAVLGTYFLTERSQLAGFVGWRAANNPSFGVTPAMVAVSQLWFTGLPLVLGLGGWMACQRKGVASALLLGGVVFPLYHLVTANSVGDSKHAVFGPRVRRAARRRSCSPACPGTGRRRLLMLPAIEIGNARVLRRHADGPPSTARGSPGILRRGSVDDLAGHVKPGQQLPHQQLLAVHPVALRTRRREPPHPVGRLRRLSDPRRAGGTVRSATMTGSSRRQAARSLGRTSCAPGPSGVWDLPARSTPSLVLHGRGPQQRPSPRLHRVLRVRGGSGGTKIVGGARALTMTSTTCRDAIPSGPRPLRGRIRSVGLLAMVSASRGICRGWWRTSTWLRRVAQRPVPARQRGARPREPAVTVINNWHPQPPPIEHVVPLGDEPQVAVIIPTSYETPEQVLRHVRARSWVRNGLGRRRIWLIISDDAHSPDMEAVVDVLQVEVEAPGSGDRLPRVRRCAGTPSAGRRQGREPQLGAGLRRWARPDVRLRGDARCG